MQTNEEIKKVIKEWLIKEKNDNYIHFFNDSFSDITLDGGNFDLEDLANSILSLQKQQMIEKGEGLRKKDNNFITDGQGNFQVNGTLNIEVYYYNSAITDYQNLINQTL